MSVHTPAGPEEIADRLAIRELFDAYAHCADRRDAEGQKSLFTEDSRFVVFMEGEGSEASYALDGREALTPVFADLTQYEATTHFNGQSTIVLDGDSATGESYTLAHHLFRVDGERCRPEGLSHDLAAVQSTPRILRPDADVDIGSVG